MCAAGVLVLAAVLLVRAQTLGSRLPKGTNVLFGGVLDMGTSQPVGGAVMTLVGYFDDSDRPALARGLTLDDARAEAQRRFGPVPKIARASTRIRPHV